jgi:hypothetical protein
LQPRWQWQLPGEAHPQKVIGADLDALQHELLRALDSMW